ncbi:hypothetical protein [Actinobaculum sp. 313]|uniref:hypothetical protein n=1 Tax=Actinobaculum sp. 313 TaxID=2495645 RepID=UPI000D526432|nr:hypothetical protein [Actinobaculum sp. 313]AWE43276.1 hypothetical protein DDD63_11545 [Actinobaculum sp. 313]
MPTNDGIIITIQETTNLRLGVGRDSPSYTVLHVRIKDGIMQATLLGGDKSTGIHQELRLGESVTHPGVGTFTLIDVTPVAKLPLQDGQGNYATFSFVPAPGFQVNPKLRN